MIGIKLREDFGGIINFPSKSEAILWCQRQRHDWMALMYKRNPNGSLVEGSVNPTTAAVARAWSDLESYISSSSSDEMDFDTNGPSGHQFRNAIMAGSDAARALYWVNDNIGDPALYGAYAAAGLGSDPIDWTDPAFTIGVVHFQRIISAYGDSRRSDSIFQARRSLEQLEGRSQSISEQVAAVERTITDARKVAQSNLEDAQARFGSRIQGQADAILLDVAAKVDDITADINNFKFLKQEVIEARDKGIEELDRHRAAYREEYLLHPAAQLWSERANEHRKAALRSGWLATVAGILGTLGTVGIFLALRCLSDGQFAAPLSGADARVKEEIARASLHYELAFSGAGTLLCLTMFLWLMRILVRRYTTHRHLAVDAAGRQALTLTYIGLIAEGAVNEQERPIVLASLFLPVNDNSVDDGPPATSLASILAAIAAGKSGAA